MATVPYHKVVLIAEALYGRIQNQAEYAPFRAQADMLRDHFIGREGRDEYANMHAALCFLLSKDNKAARNVIGDERRVSVEGARNILLKAVNEGPKEWLSDTEYFYEKGLIPSSGRYYTAPDDLVKDSLYDQIARAVPEHHQSILLKALAIRLARPTKGESTGVTTMGLIYTGIQLLEESEKTFRMNAMSTQETPRRHQENLGLSYDIIQSVCKELEIDMPKDLLGEHALRRQKQGSSQKPKTLQQGASRPFKDAQVAQNIQSAPENGGSQKDQSSYINIWCL